MTARVSTEIRIAVGVRLVREAPVAKLAFVVPRARPAPRRYKKQHDLVRRLDGHPPEGRVG